MTGWTDLQADGLTWRARAGAGPAMLLLHGIGSHAASWSLLLPHLPSDAHVIAWNAPGYGGSDPLPMDWPLAADYAASVATLLNRLDLATVHLVGHSLGALIAAAFAVRTPDRVSRLTLAAPALGHGVAQHGALSPAAQARIDGLTREGAAAFARTRAPRLIHIPERHPDALAVVEGAMSRITLPGYAQAVRMLASGRLTEDAARLSVPTDVIFGAEDRVTPPDTARRAHAALPSAVRGRLTEIPGTGHAIYQQAPEAFARALHMAAEPSARPGPTEDMS